MSNPNDYTVGWICAISTELVAARAFLDEEHDPPNAVSPRDNNIYTLGKMGKHNIVIAALPDGEYGISAAASVARDMLHSFPNVRIGLMVGIGGGVPGRHDVRLGDVVVSATHNEQAGIFQYDFGKTIQAQEFQNTMFLNQPPALLRSAVGGLKADYESNGHQFQETINSILTRKPRLRKKYQRPDSNTDRLYLSNAVHPLTNNESCSKACSDLMLVPREQRAEDEDDPIIHYGLIASGNQLMKDALIRDQLASEKDILCFEIEAAGLMNHFPCLVIRGICDYSDSHKNKIWQGYAAMTAAAYAKDLVGRIPPTKIEAENCIADVLSGVKETVDRLVNVYHDERNIAILDWLISLNYSTQLSDYLRRRQEGTGNWLLSSDQFQMWVKTEKQMLFCPGMPGAGKTVLTSIVVDYLHSWLQTDSKAGIAYFFFDYKRQEEQTIEALLAVFLRQLTACQTSLPDAVHKLYKQHNTQAKQTRPSAEELTQVLKSVIGLYSRVFIIIDALDECNSPNGTRSRVLSGIFKLRNETGANFFITSRFNTEISSAFSSIPQLKIRASNEDVQRYLIGNMGHLPKFVQNDPSLQEEIIDSILQAVQGMFLLARFHLDSLKGKTKPKEISNALQNLATGSDAYEQIYTEIMNRIVGQYEEQAQLAKSVLSWLTFAKRPMRVDELQQALGVEPGESSFDKRNMPDIELMVSVCAGLVTIDNGSNIIRLVHYTTQEYFQRSYEEWLPGPQSVITVTCVTYLSYEVFEFTTDDNRDYIAALLEPYAFYDYARLYWGDHARENSVPIKAVMEFLKNAAKIKSYCRLLEKFSWIRDNRVPWGLEKQITGLHLATWFGLTADVDLLLNNNTHIEATNDSGETALHVAATRGHEDIVQLLLENNADIEAIDRFGNTPLYYAATPGHKAVVQLLLDNNVDIVATNGSGLTAMHAAAMYGHEDIIQLGQKVVVQRLLDNNAYIEAANHHDNAPLHVAAEKGNRDIVHLLLENNVSIEVVDLNKRTPVHVASLSRHANTVQVLLDNADVEVLDELDDTPLQVAVCLNYDKYIGRILLDRGANIDAVDKDGSTPLQVAVSEVNSNIVEEAESRKDIIQLLLNYGADINAVNNDGNTPLHEAVVGCDSARVRLLLKSGANIEALDRNLDTALQVAAMQGQSETVKVLLKHNASVEAAVREDCTKLLLKHKADLKNTDHRGNTPLHCAAYYGAWGDVELLLKWHARINATNTNGRTALHQAVSSDSCAYHNIRSAKHEMTVKVLVKNNANIEAADKDGKTPLHLAIESRHKDAARFLLKRKANVNATDLSGKTPLFYAIECLRLGETPEIIEQLVQLLLDYGANVQVTDNLGRTVQDVAIEKKCYSVITLLIGARDSNIVGSGSPSSLGEDEEMDDEEDDEEDGEEEDEEDEEDDEDDEDGETSG
ncbi:ankyrin repeat-containing domain protein [Trichoderma sp. SZMC 28015]